MGTRKLFFISTAWQIWSREIPYSGQHNQAAVFAVVAYGARPHLPSLTDRSLQEKEGLSFPNLSFLLAFKV